MTAKQILKSKMGKILEQLKAEVGYVKPTGDALENDETWEKLMKTKEKLMDEEDYSDDEAINGAFKNREEVLVKVVNKCRDLLEDIVQENIDDDSDDGDDAGDNSI
ncbi:MAG: hypothetical protein GY820_35970 [Gammaproteobacteria bacterium]|nr:hypothetical protein [Gammaproteobacteria bacterium]